MEWDILGEEKTKEAIRRFVPLVNAELGRNECNNNSVAYFYNLIGRAFFAWDEYWYVVALPVRNMWGDMTLCVVSFYVVPEMRKNPKYFRQILKKLGVFAKHCRAEYIEIGSHINPKLYDFLQKQGFEISAMRKATEDNRRYLWE